jgi:hypothetical protein
MGFAHGPPDFTVDPIQSSTARRFRRSTMDDTEVKLAAALANAQSWKEKYERAHAEAQTWKGRANTWMARAQAKEQSELNSRKAQGGSSVVRRPSDRALETDKGRADQQPPSETKPSSNVASPSSAKLRLTQKQRKEHKVVHPLSD